MSNVKTCHGNMAIENIVGKHSVMETGDKSVKYDADKADITEYDAVQVDIAQTEATEATSFGAVILAAGYSSRMKAFKPLLPVGETSAIEKIVMTLQKVGIGDIVVVTGHNREKLVPVIRGMNLEEAYNEHYDKGMFSSIRAGLANAKIRFPKKRAFFLIPVDCPLIGEGVLKAIIDTTLGSAEIGVAVGEFGEHRFYVPVYEGKKGHPLMVPASYIDEICAYDGPGGLKGITDKYWEKMIRIPVNDEGCLLDMDTPEGYKEIKEFLNSGGKRQDIRELARGRRIFLVRHGETVQHDEKIFIGQYDVLLSDAGRRQMEETALKLVAEKPRTNRIYTSDLSRAEESAAIIAGRLNGSSATQELITAEQRIVRPPAGSEECNSRIQVEDEKGVCFVQLEKLPSLREINLGTWDGKKISCIKKERPEEYERRGAELFTFKTGNKSENFYDMQYRAVKVLRAILQSDPSRDIIIVAHSGVIRALENNLRGLRVDDSWDKLDKGTFRIV